MKTKFKEIQNSLIQLFKNKVFILVLILIAADLLLGAYSRHLVSKLPEQAEASRWSDGRKMTQVSAFFTEDQLIDSDYIRKLEYILQAKMNDVGIIEDDDDEGSDSKGPVIIDTQTLDETNADSETALQEEVDDSRLYASCYSAQGIISITFENKMADKVTAIGTEGDFFLFHPLELVSGSYYSPDALMKDGIVIDEDLAWQLFGSNDVVGQMVMIGDVPHYVSGVVKREEGKMRKASGQNASIAYISYDSLCKYGTILSGRTESAEIAEDGTTASKGGINCYEVVMPGPVDGIVAQIVKESAAIDDAYISVIDNTERFSFFALLNVIMSYGTRSMWNKAIFFPYWENLARGYEDILATLLLIRLICRTIVVVIIVLFIIRSYRNKNWTVRGIFNDLMEKKYDYEVRRAQKKL
ncbi:MacB-like periplasmic core domain [Butyrivibrio sp. Su6]|uniref:ABC transporter permease n=1 Tax=Butyrivibrio sp. Su6 TaxID=1520810 RepID=UPI00089E6D0B|nr:ABC transporter permease [Butyrivibrio sp. Su6]SEF51038.1 MacB-like periplasmic core domain [Butyrivibrio sp. Su6]